MKENNKETKIGSHSIANTILQNKQNGKSFPAVSATQLKGSNIVQKVEEEEPLQGKFGTIQKQEAKAENNTGMPDNLKAGIEGLSGVDVSDVKVHFNSSKPAQLNAHAYAQGSDIHIGPGQEKHLPHEAWHIVQQKQGRVQPTIQMRDNLNVNNFFGVEKEPSVTNDKSLNVEPSECESNFDRKELNLMIDRPDSARSKPTYTKSLNSNAIQRKKKVEPGSGRFNVIGESHDFYSPAFVRSAEKKLIGSISPNYFQEGELQINLTSDDDPEYNNQFGGGPGNRTDRYDSADPANERIMWLWKEEFHKKYKEDYTRERFISFQRKTGQLKEHLENLQASGRVPNGIIKTEKYFERLPRIMSYVNEFDSIKTFKLIDNADNKLTEIEDFLESCLEVWNFMGLGGGRNASSKRRSVMMSENAQKFGKAGKSAVWKVGDSHVDEIYSEVESKTGGQDKTNKYDMVSESQFKRFMWRMIGNAPFDKTRELGLTKAIYIFYSKLSGRSLFEKWHKENGIEFEAWVNENSADLKKHLQRIDESYLDKNIEGWFL